jgi:hypothetical protein
MTWIIPRISSFQVGGPSSSAWSGGAVSLYEVYGSPNYLPLEGTNRI